jgi:hypothetical protein
VQEPLTRRSPALEALFAALQGDGRHRVLDLGEADGRRLGLLGRFARSVRFAGLLPGGPVGEEWLGALTSLPSHPRRAYDVVLAWDLLDRVPPSHHADVVARLAEITADGARLYAVVDSSTDPTRRSVAFTLADLEHVQEREIGHAGPAGTPLLPAQVERALAPFQVARAFTLRSGQREYVAVKPG